MAAKGGQFLCLLFVQKQTFEVIHVRIIFILKDVLVSAVCPDVYRCVSYPIRLFVNHQNLYNRAGDSKINMTHRATMATYIGNTSG